MKIRQLLTAFLFLAIAVTACQPKEPEPATISVDPTELTFDISAGTKTVTVKSNYAWEAKWDASWVTVTPSKGEAAPTGVTVTISVLENKDKNQSTAITFYGNGSRLVNASVSIEQEGPNGDGNDPAKAQLVTVQDFISRANTTDYLRLQGVISGFNANYCSFDITDASGKIYVYSVDDESKAQYANVLKNGDTLTIAGKYMYYSSKQQHEVVDAVILERKAAAAVDPSKAEAKTVAEFIAAANTSTYFKLTGKVSSFNATYCSFDLTDDSGKIYVYSVDSDSKAKYVSVIKNGGTVTIAGKYLYYESKQQHEVVEAVILEFTPAASVDPSKAEAKTVTEFIAAAKTDTYYKLTGTVSSFNSTYCSFDLTDASGKIYVYSVDSDSKAKYASVIKNGGTVTIAGKYAYYSAKEQHEVVEAVILEYKDGGSGDTPDYNNAEAKTVAEFLAAANTTTYYKLTGTVSSFNSTYCSFDLTDDSGTIYVYSVTAESKSTYASAIKNGDTVTLAGKYLYYENGQKHEVVEAQILDHKSQGGSSTDVKVVTVNEFLGMPDSDQTTIYQLTGVITNVGDTDGGKFDLKDDTGTVYVYGLYDAEGNKVFTAKSLKAGDTLTVQGPRQNYQGTIEVNKGVYVSHKVGPAQKTMTATHPFTSTDTCAIDNSKKSYTAEVIIEGTTYKAWKFGTSSVAGIATLKLPAGTKSVSFYAVGWNNLVGELEVLNGSDKIASITAAKNSGIANNSPFTITTLSDNDYYTVTFASPLAAETTLTIQTTGSSSSKTYRAVIFGINSTK